MYEIRSFLNPTNGTFIDVAAASDWKPMISRTDVLLAEKGSKEQAGR